MCGGNPTCAITCVSHCQNAVSLAQLLHTTYVHAVELIVKSEPPAKDA